MSKSLLPLNATDFERDLEQAAARIDNMPIDVGKLWDPDSCPASLLPWLAWAMSVDEWDREWNEDTQRSLIKHAAYTHRQKGTVGAVKKALSALGVTVDFLEWFQDVDDLALAPIHNTQPYTFVFIAWANENPYTSNEVFLNPELYDAITRIVNQLKPARAHFDFLIGVKLESGLFAGATSGGWSQVGRFGNRTVPVQSPPFESELGIGISENGNNMQVRRIGKDTAPVQIPPSTTEVALGLSSSGNNAHIGRLTNRTNPVQPPTLNAATMGTNIHVSGQRYAIARFYLEK
ncbi:MAG: phage tail P2-like protein [Phenylobacterium sp.]|jgi:phage tail P2-like protein